MSAIACIYNSNKEPVVLEHIHGMMGSLQQFPADDIQVWHKEHIFLGCHAQWITPESFGEQLPYYDSERQIGITVDAIIDNRDELFELLQVERSKRKEMPDSQLILLAYCKWGEDCPKYLIGDFAFIIWDERKERLFGARDFSGTRTLYYTQRQEKITLCTTIKPFFTLPFIKKQLNEQWLAEFLAIPGMHETVEVLLTPYEGILQIPPSHYFFFESGKLTVKQYVTLTSIEKIKLKSNEEYEEVFRDVFQRAVIDRTRTDRKVGSQLSGGLDSGTVVSFASKILKQQNKTLHTFSYIPIKEFKDWTPKNRIANEKPQIESTIEYVGNIKAKYMDFEGKSPYSVIDDWLEIYEMPYKFFENSYWTKGIYEEAGKENIGILLNGTRGNWSISWGAALDYQAKLLKNMKLLSFYREITQYSKNIGVNRSKVFSVVKKKAFPFLYRSLYQINSYEPYKLINPEFENQMRVNENIQKNRMDYGSFVASFNANDARRDHFEQLSYWNKSGTNGTKLSLRHKLWHRDPTNDLRVIRFCLAIPEEQYVQNGIDRSLIRRATNRYLPDEIRMNQKVRGIQGTDGISRMAPDWKEFLFEIENIIHDSTVCEYLNIVNIKKLYKDILQVPDSPFIFDNRFKVLMRSVIVYRFLKSLT